LSSWTKDKVILSAQQWGITFPVAINGVQTGNAYAASGNVNHTIFLIDKQGIVRAVAGAPLAPDSGSAQVDSAVKSIAGKIPALLNTAIKQRRMTAYDAAYRAAVDDNSKWTSDLKGRRLERAGAMIAPQMVIDGARSAGTLLRRK
jgi:hypothetical protein